MTRCFTLRNSLGDTQKAFGARLGISQTHVSKIEGGVVAHSETLDLLMDAIAVKHGLLHLTAAAYAAGPDLATGEASCVTVAPSPSGDAGGDFAGSAGAVSP